MPYYYPTHQLLPMLGTPVMHHPSRQYISQTTTMQKSTSDHNTAKHHRHQHKMPKRGLTSTQDLCYYKLVHILGKCFAILPNFNLDRIDKFASNYCYSLLVLCTLLGIYTFGTYGKFHHMRSLLAPSVFLTEVASDMAIISTNVVTILRINVSKGRSVCRMLGRLITIDRELRHIDEKLVGYPSRRFIVELTFILTFFAIFLIYNIYIWMASVGWTVFRFWIMRDVQNFQVLITAILLSSYATAMKNRVTILNKMLVHLNPHVDIDSDLFAFSVRTASTKRTCCPIDNTVKKLRKIFGTLMQALDDYNSIFGWVHLILYVNIVITLLNPINLMLVYGVGDREFPAGSFDIRLVILCIIWSALPVLIATWIFSACDECVAEIKKIPNICNCLVQELGEDNPASSDLEKFAQQVANSCPEFTAAGFYTINYNIYFSLIGSITTYLIVLIQFR